MRQHIGGKNGQSIAVPDQIEQERRMAFMQAQALNNAKGAFRATIATAASRIAASVLSGSGREFLDMPEGQKARIASDAVDLARLIAIKAHGCEFPTAAELGQDDAEQAPQEG